jgi:hypothetical protein
MRASLTLIYDSGIGSLLGQVYQVPLAALQLLEEVPIDYRRATDAEVQRCRPAKFRVPQ